MDENMRAVLVTVVAAWAATLGFEAFAEESFDACAVFTRMRLQTKPMLISGEEAFWSAKTGSPRFSRKNCRQQQRPAA